MGECRLCGRRDITISSFLGVCGRCIKERFWQIKDYIFGIHPALREKKVSQNNCPLCINRCTLTSPVTICGLRGLSQDNPTKEEAYLEYYYDFLPTNCVAEKFCAATGWVTPIFLILLIWRGAIKIWQYFFMDVHLTVYSVKIILGEISLQEK